MICVVCPGGCDMNVKLEGENVTVKGNACNRGHEYAVNELFDPRRTLTTTVKAEIEISGEKIVKLAPVKSAEPIPKGILMQAVKEINKMTMKSHAKKGDAVIRNILSTGIDIVLTDNI